MGISVRSLPRVIVALAGVLILALAASRLSGVASPAAQATAATLKLQLELKKDERFANVQVLRSSGDPPEVILNGQVSSESDLRDLEQVVAARSSSAPVDLQITVTPQPGNEAPSPRSPR
jgi:hypothetical protein